MRPHRGGVNRSLQEQAERAVELGDYRRARTLFLQLADGSGDGARFGQKRLETLRIDKAALAVGALAGLFYLAAWILVL